MTAVRKWFARKLWGWSVRVYEDMHEITVLDGDGNDVFHVVCYGQYCASWQKPYDMMCSCE